MEYLNDATARHGARPLSVREIAQKAVDFDYNPLIPLRYWLRTADTVLKEAIIYQGEGNEQQAYLLLLRHAELVIRYLPTHPDATRPENVRSLRAMKTRVDGDVFRRLDYLKPRIHARYEEYVKSSQSRRVSSISSHHTTIYSSATPSGFSQNQVRKSSTPRALDLSLSRRGSTASLTGPFSPPLERVKSPEGNRGDARVLAMEMAKQEFERREREKRDRRRKVAAEQGRGLPIDSSGREIRRISTPVSTGLNDGHRALRVQYAPPSIDYNYGSNGNDAQRETEEERLRRENEEEEWDLARSIEALHMKVDLSERQMQQPSKNYANLSWMESAGEREKAREKERAVGNWQGSYPTVPKRSSPSQIPPPPLPGPAVEEIIIRSVTPTPPPKLSYYDSSENLYYSAPPALPEKKPLAPPPPPKSLAKASEKPFEFTTPATLENGTPLRTLFIPAALRQQFLLMAQPNTRSNLETCGILCGTLIQNALFVSRLVIPEQEATSDTCATKDEEGLFEYCDTEDLMVLGWIHTHPSQTCFMSSVDLHTHCGYQLMLPESIAIVCAPSKNPSWGVFRLTDPPGVKAIMNCRQKGLFHPHAEEEVYTDAMRPGHVCEVREMGFDVVDLRK